MSSSCIKAEETTKGEVKDEDVTTEVGSNRPQSPDTSCSICLDVLNNRAYIDSCLHQFCFDCLFQWSKVKPECPLCKQRFSFIIHNVRSMTDYEKLAVPQPTHSFPTDMFDLPGTSRDSQRFHSNLLINIAFQRLSGRSSGASYLETGWEETPAVLVRPLPIMRHTMPPATEWRRRQRESSELEFRRTIYRNGQWARPSTRTRSSREATPSFYREDPFRFLRLVPWVIRELSVLLDVRFNCYVVCSKILGLLTQVSIRSQRFMAELRPYLGSRTEHFCHEFYHFAISSYDMVPYDLHTEYTQMDTFNADEPVWIPDDSDSSAREISRSFNNLIEFIEPEVETIVISDTEEVITVDEDIHSDSSVEIIATLPPISQRDPEVVISLDDSEEEKNYSRELLVDIGYNTTTDSQESQRKEEKSRARKKEKPTNGTVDSKERSQSRSSSKHGRKRKQLQSSSSEDEVTQARERRHWKKRIRRRASRRRKYDDSYSSSSNGKEKSEPMRLRSVVFRVDPGEGCSSWIRSDTDSEPTRRRLRPRDTLRPLIWNNYPSSDSE